MAENKWVTGVKTKPTSRGPITPLTTGRDPPGSLGFGATGTLREPY